jgi:hypothetical protein
MDRTEANGFGVALAGHVALLAALSAGFAVPRKPVAKSQPIEVSFVDEVGLESSSPTPAAEAPAPLQAAAEGPPVPAAMSSPPQVEPIRAPQPQPAAPTPAPAAKAPPKSPPPVRPAVVQPRTPASNPTGRLKGLLNGVADRASDSKSTQVPAAKAGPAVQASLGAEVRRQLKPHWKAPTGADAEQLRTEVAISLAPGGEVTGIRVLATTGQTASNRPQVRLHQEQAERAVRLAAPFRLPAEYYSAWKQLRVTFDKRLSQ